MQALLTFARDHFRQMAARLPGYQVPKVGPGQIQRYGHVIEDFVRKNHPDVSAYLVPHEGPGIPKGVQAVIRRMEDFEVEVVVDKSEDRRDTRPTGLRRAAE